MKLIDRYVYAVTEHLPEDTREDVSRELHANIEDMLPENPTDEDVREVLEGLGNPRKLSSEYSQVKKYLIGPDLYDSYFSVLKLVVSIVAIVFSFIALLTGVFMHPVDSGLVEMSIKVIVNMIVAVIQGTTQAFLWVTLVFVILERTGVNDGKMPFVKKKWAIEDLPSIPVSNKRKISRVETAFSMFFTVLFAAWLYSAPQLIGIYGKGNGGFGLIAPLLTIERLKDYIFIILLLAGIQLCILIWKFISMRWTLPIATANAIYNTAVIILFCVMIGDGALLNQEFISSFADIMKSSVSQISSTWLLTMRISGAVFILINLFDSINGFIKCRK